MLHGTRADEEPQLLMKNRNALDAALTSATGTVAAPNLIPHHKTIFDRRRRLTGPLHPRPSQLVRNGHRAKIAASSAACC